MTDEQKARVEKLRARVEKLDLELFSADPEAGLYYLAKKQPLSGDYRRLKSHDMPLEDIEGFIAEEEAVEAALVPTYWRAQVRANIENRNEGEPVNVIVQVLAKDEDAPELAYEQASRFVKGKYSCATSVPPNAPYATPAEKPNREPDGFSPGPRSFPVSIE